MDSTGNAPDPDLREAAVLLDVSMDTLRKRIKRGQVQAYKAGGRWYVPVPDNSPDQSRTSVNGQPPGRNPDRGPDMQFLREEIERLWGEIRERDALIERLTRPMAIAAPADTVAAHAEAPPEPKQKRRGFWQWLRNGAPYGG